jgi:hypothetical protein
MMCHDRDTLVRQDWSARMDAVTSRPAGRPVLLLLPFVLALLAAVVLLVIPTGREESVSISSTGEITRHSRSTTLVQSDGWSVLVRLAVPVAFAGVPLALRRTRWRRGALVAASVLLLAFVVAGLLSIGVIFLPAAIAMVTAAIVDGRRPTAPRGPAAR